MKITENMVKGPARWLLSFCLLALLPLMASCSEDDGQEEEYPNWPATNEAYFTEKFQEYYNSQSDKRLVLPKLSLAATPTGAQADHPEDYILVDVISKGTGKSSPLYSDSVACHIKGNLLPSRSYPQGFPFAYSYEGEFDEATSSPATYLVMGTVEGFATALQYMHRGDHWRVIIPYQMGYDTAGSGTTIPGYSTLIYEIRLVDFWSKTRGDRYLEELLSE